MTTLANMLAWLTPPGPRTALRLACAFGALAIVALVAGAFLAGAAVGLNGIGAIPRGTAQLLAVTWFALAVASAAAGAYTVIRFLAPGAGRRWLER